MPYIADDLRRFQLEQRLDTPKNTGELNFLLTTVVLAYLAEHGLSYATNSQITAALGDAKGRVRAPRVRPVRGQEDRRERRRVP